MQIGGALEIQHYRGESSVSAGVMAVVSFSIVKSTMSGVCVWEMIDSPATPTPKAINASTTQQDIKEFG